MILPNFYALQLIDQQLNRLSSTYSEHFLTSIQQQHTQLNVQVRFGKVKS